MKLRKVTPKDVSSYTNENLYDENAEDVDIVRRQLDRTKCVVDAILTQLSPAQLLAIVKYIHGDTVVYENFESVELTE